METISIRKAGVEDIPVIRDIAWKTFPETYRDIITGEQIEFMMEWMYSEESLRGQMTEEGHTYLLATQGNEPVGYVSFQPEGEGLFHLQKIYVLPQCQAAHVGSTLFKAAVTAIKGLHPAPCTLELNVNRSNKALGFYERMGMTKRRDGDFPIGGGFFMNDYIMGMEI